MPEKLVASYCLGANSSSRVVSLLVLATSHQFLFTASANELRTELTVVPQLRGVLQFPELHEFHARYASSVQYLFNEHYEHFYTWPCFACVYNIMVIIVDKCI